MQRYQNPDAFFRFPLQSRPPDLGRGELDVYRYHRICEFDENEDDTPKYTTKQTDDGSRTDFGLLQRYVVPHEGGKIVVFGIWGCSTLGTLAAALWATKLDETTITKPNIKLDVNTPVEALVRVQAKVREYPQMWSPEPVEPQQLIIGTYHWSFGAETWRLRPDIQMIWRQTSDSSGDIIISGEIQHVSKGQLFDVINQIVTRGIQKGEKVHKSIILKNEKFKYSSRLADYTKQIIVFENEHFCVNRPIKKFTDSG